MVLKGLEVVCLPREPSPRLHLQRRPALLQNLLLHLGILGVLGEDGLGDVDGVDVSLRLHVVEGQLVADHRVGAVGEQPGVLVVEGRVAVALLLLHDEAHVFVGLDARLKEGEKGKGKRKGKGKGLKMKWAQINANSKCGFWIR